uniref:C2H2-type domain-containing protein n=2 Tax=Tetranychus urticae TaxID=32264 RepID=T1KNP0_TETUR
MMAPQKLSPSEESLTLTLIEKHSARSSPLTSKSINLDFLDQTTSNPVTKSAVKKRIIVNLVERDGFIYMEEYDTNEYVPLNERDVKQIKGEQSKSIEVKKIRNRGPPGDCSFCGKRFGRRSTANRHERENCKNHGAPNHLCDESCPGFSSNDSNQDKKKQRTRE